MTKKIRLNVQDVFNEIAMAQDVSAASTALNKIDLLKAQDKKKILNKLESRLVEDFLKNVPSIAEVESIISFKSLGNLPGIFVTGIDEVEERKRLNNLHAGLLTANKVIKDKKGKTNSFVKSLTENMSNLSNSEYNDFNTVLLSMAKTAERYKNNTLKPF